MAGRGINKNIGCLISGRNNVKRSFLELIDNLLSMRYFIYFMISYREELANLFHKGPDSKYVRCCGPLGICQKYSTLPYVNQGISTLALLIFWAGYFVMGSCPMHCLAISLVTRCPYQMQTIPPPLVTTRNISRHY